MAVRVRGPDHLQNKTASHQASPSGPQQRGAPYYFLKERKRDILSEKELDEELSMGLLFGRALGVPVSKLLNAVATSSTVYRSYLLRLPLVYWPASYLVTNWR